MPLPPGTIWVCDSDVKAPTDDSSAGQWFHMCSELKVQEKNKSKHTSRDVHMHCYSKLESYSNTVWTVKHSTLQEKESWML